MMEPVESKPPLVVPRHPYGDGASGLPSSRDVALRHDPWLRWPETAVEARKCLEDQAWVERALAAVGSPSQALHDVAKLAALPANQLRDLLNKLSCRQDFDDAEDDLEIFIRSCAAAEPVAEPSHAPAVNSAHSAAADQSNGEAQAQCKTDENAAVNASASTTKTTTSTVVTNMGVAEANSVVDESRVLASVVTVRALEELPKAEKIELASYHENAWRVVVKKGGFKSGDRAVYFAIDSLLDAENEEFKFLGGKPLKTKKIFGVYSQGLCLPVSCVAKYGADPGTLTPGQDVTQLLRVKKWVCAAEAELYDQKDNKAFPSFVPKTDERRVQDCKARLEEIVRDDLDVVITEKQDGTSTTYVLHKDGFLVCGRNFAVTDGVYVEMAKKYDVEAKMRALGRNLAIQGETTGPKINGNRMQMKEVDFAVFNIWDIDAGRYLCWDQVEPLCAKLGLKTVRVLHKGKLKPEWQTVQGLLEYANRLKYKSGALAEGFVLKTNHGPQRPRISFKVISNEFLVKHAAKL